MYNDNGKEVGSKDGGVELGFWGCMKCTKSQGYHR